MKITKPKKLNTGDTIGLIAPASAPQDSAKIQIGVTYLEQMGYRVKLGKNTDKELGYLAGTDDERLSDIHEMFKDKEVKAIFCLRGGYGSGRLLDKLNYNLIKKNPKIFVGFSDITALQMAILQKTGLVTFAGPMVLSNFTDEINEYSEEIFWKTLTSNKKIGKLNNPEGEKFFVLNKLRGEGQIIGGTLSIISSLMGTGYLPDFKNKILLLEEVAESPYRVDRMFNQLRLAKAFSQAKGIILGRFVDCYETDMTKKTLSLNEVIADYFSDLKIPLIYNVKHGHVKDTITIPYGLKAKVNASRCFIEIPENGVS